MDDKRTRFEAQVLPHLDAAYRFARWLSRSPEEAGDIVQDAVLRAFRSFNSLRGTDAKAWLLAIVRNCQRTAWGRQQRHVLGPLPAEEDPHGHALVADTGPEAVAILADEQRSVEQWVASLPSNLREVLILRKLEELGYREIAAVLNVPIGTVMSRLARARAALRDLWRHRCGADAHAP